MVETVSKLSQLRALGDANRQRKSSGGGVDGHAVRGGGESAHALIGKAGIKPGPSEAKSKARSSTVEPAAHNGSDVGSNPAVPTKLKRGRPFKPETKDKPWIAQGISRRSWYRRKAEAKGKKS
jgi:hypothetical protein